MKLHHVQLPDKRTERNYKPDDKVGNSHYIFNKK